MTVAELIEAILRLYPGASPEALNTFRPVFQARFKHREGAALASAAQETFATFQAKATKPFPIPVDFEQHLEDIVPKDKGSGPKIDFAAHRARKDALMADWEERQGRGITKARGEKIAASCRSTARDIAHMRAWSAEPPGIVLTAEQIQKCEDHVVSCERMGTYGAHCIRTENAEAWQAQMDELRPMVRAGRSPSKERKAKIEEKHFKLEGRATKRVAELARAKRAAFMADRVEAAE